MRPSEGKLSALFVPLRKSQAKSHVRKKHPVPVMHRSSFVERSGPDEEMDWTETIRGETRVDDDLQKSLWGLG